MQKLSSGLIVTLPLKPKSQWLIPTMCYKGCYLGTLLNCRKENCELRENTCKFRHIFYAAVKKFKLKHVKCVKW